MKRVEWANGSKGERRYGRTRRRIGREGVKGTEYALVQSEKRGWTSPVRKSEPKARPAKGTSSPKQARRKRQVTEKHQQEKKEGEQWIQDPMKQGNARKGGWRGQGLALTLKSRAEIDERSKRYCTYFKFQS
jgi:hypothetical protein